MKWIPNVSRQSVLPILFGISLTTFGLSVAIMLYTMFQTEDDNDNRKKKSDQIAKGKCKEVSIQIKIPEKYISAIIGKGGIVIKNIEELTNTRIKMEKENFYSPERICHIWSNNIENIQAAQNMIQNIVENLPVIETFELFVPFEASRMLFARNLKANEFIKEIQKTYGAKIIVENNAHETTTGLKRRIILKGTADQIASAVVQIEEKVQEEIETNAELKLQYASAKTFRHSKNDKNVISNSDSEICDYLLPYEVYKEVIEKDQNIMQEIEKLNDVKIIFDDKTTAGYDGKEKKIILKGTNKQINLALHLIENKMQDIHKCQNESNSNNSIEEKEDLSFHNNNSNTLNILNSVLEQDGFMEVYVSAMKTPSLFWIQVMGSTNIELKHLECEMTNYYNKEENRKLHALKKITVGQMVAAKFKYDNKWYRAEVISIVDSSIYEVFYVDYGDLEIVSKDDMSELCTEMLSLRHQAIECSLANVKPKEDTWNIQVVDKFAELVYLARWIPLIARVKNYKDRPIDQKEFRRQSSLIPCIDLYDRNKNMSIADELIRLGMAEIDEKISLESRQPIEEIKNVDK